MSDDDKADRAERLAAALRSNLRRRKQQARERAGSDQQPSADEDKSDGEG